MQDGDDHFVALPVPNAHRIELWFKSVDENCTAYDSDFGRNYGFDVVSSP